jgi:hypothetical protein
MNSINYWSIFDGRALLLVAIIAATWAWYYLTK